MGEWEFDLRSSAGVRALGVAFAVIGVVALLSLALTAPEQPAALAVIAVAAWAVAAVVLVTGLASRPAGTGWRPTPRVVHVLVVVAVALAAVGVAAGDGGPVATAHTLVFVLIVVYAGLFMSRRAMLGHVAVAALAFAPAIWGLGIADALVLWLLLTATLLAAGVLISWLRERVTDLQQTDPLTGAANRHHWEQGVARECARATRTGHPLCVVMLHMDDFEQFAFERGHPAGDQLLAESAQAWMRVIRYGDVLARLRGGEFGLLLPECGSAAAGLVLDRLRTATPDGKTCSAGIAMWNGGESADVVINRAAEALRVAKRSGHQQSFVSAA